MKEKKKKMKARNKEYTYRSIIKWTESADYHLMSQQLNTIKSINYNTEITTKPKFLFHFELWNICNTRAIRRSRSKFFATSGLFLQNLYHFLLLCLYQFLLLYRNYLSLFLYQLFPHDYPLLLQLCCVIGTFRL